MRYMIILLAGAMLMAGATALRSAEAAPAGAKNRFEYAWLAWGQVDISIHTGEKRYDGNTNNVAALYNKMTGQNITAAGFVGLLNAMGSDGWELIGTNISGGAENYFFKRPAP